MRLWLCNCILIQSQLGRNELATRRRSSASNGASPAAKVGLRQRQMLTDKPISPHKLLSTLSNWQKGKRAKLCQLTVSASAFASALAAATTATDTRRRHYAKPAKRQIKNANAVSHRRRRGCGGLLGEGAKGIRHLPS